MLMGRRTDEFSAAAFPHQTGEYGRRINTMRKHFFSNTLTRADWSNSSIVKGDVAAEAAKLKREDGRDLVIYGHGRLAQTLLERDLLDEIKLWIHPVFVGGGQLLFSEGAQKRLELVGAKTLGAGVVVLTYRPRS